MKKIHIIIVLFLLPAALFANDFGLVANIRTEGVGYTNEDPSFNFKFNLWPRFSALIGSNGEFFASAGFTFGMEDDDFFYIPEILQTEFSIFSGNFGFRIGRMNYSDPLSFVTEGLLDGLQFTYISNAGRFNIGAWYTGFLYKKNANITMTEYEQNKFDLPVDYDDFFNTYFASRRVVAALGWEHPSLGERLHLSTTVIGQMDLTDADIQHHSQYLVIKAAIPRSNFLMELGGIAALSQITEDENDINMAFAGEIGFSWILPSNFNSRFSLTGRVASGKTEGFCEAFVPITTKYFGNILKHKFSGLSILTLNYTACFVQTFGASLSASYFVRNDLGTFSGYPVSPDSDGYFLGPEVYLRLVWSPVSDIQFNLGGGAFFPSLGDAGQDEPIRWRAELSVTMSLL